MTKIDKLRVNTQKAATTAHANGLVSDSLFHRLTDGKVTKTDLKQAEKALASAEKVASDLRHHGAASSTDKKTAEKRVSIAEALVEAVEDQLRGQDAQPTPSTSSGKGSSRPSTSSGKGTSRPSTSRPSTSSGKGTSRPSTSSGKGSSRPKPAPAPAPSRPSTSSSKGGGVRRPGGK